MSMFVDKKPFKAPPGSRVSWAVKYPKGRKPFTLQCEAELFAAEQRHSTPEGWAQIDMVVEITVSPRS